MLNLNSWVTKKNRNSFSSVTAVATGILRTGCEICHLTSVVYWPRTGDGPCDWSREAAFRLSAGRLAPLYCFLSSASLSPGGGAAAAAVVSCVQRKIGFLAASSERRKRDKCTQTCIYWSLLEFTCLLAYEERHSHSCCVVKPHLEYCLNQNFIRVSSAC